MFNFVLVLICCIIFRCVGLSPTQYSSLHAVFEGGNGNYWVWDNSSGSSWSFDTGSDPCGDNWQGVFCTDQTDVVELSLENMNISGTLSREINGLTSLTALTIKFSTMHSSIPSTLCDLSHLVNMTLSYNSFSGTLPSCLYKLSSMSTFRINSNSIIGTLPSSLLSGPNYPWSELSILDIQSNRMNGTIASTIGDALPKLQYIDLSENSFSGSILQFLCPLTKLSVLNMHYTAQESIPSCIGGLIDLTILGLSYTNISGMHVMSILLYARY